MIGQTTCCKSEYYQIDGIITSCNKPLAQHTMPLATNGGGEERDERPLNFLDWSIWFVDRSRSSSLVDSKLILSSGVSLLDDLIFGLENQSAINQTRLLTCKSSSCIRSSWFVFWYASTNGFYGLRHSSRYYTANGHKRRLRLQCYSLIV